jgi:type VI secretion system protein ImpF
MADLALKDRLQPALLDRLIDDERAVALIRVVTSESALRELGLPLQSLVDILGARGLTPQRQSIDGNTVELLFTASRDHTSPAQLRTLILRPPCAPDGVALQSFATLESTVVPNVELEPAERRNISMRKLRECVQRDLGWLLNSINLDSAEDLSAFPQVASSVLNFGLPSFAGRMTSSIDQNEVAHRLKRAIELFEPRLSGVHVSPDAPREGEDDGTIRFSIEADLWGQPASQHLLLRTTIDVITGDITLAEVGGR